MRNCILFAITGSLILAGFVSHAEAQPARRFGSRLRGGQAPATTPRTDGQFRERLQNLGGKLQTAIDSGALDSLLDKSALDKSAGDLGSNVPAAGTGSPSSGDLRTEVTAANQPFTPGWYADHPKAWQYTHPHVDAWAVSTIGTAAAWLGIATPLPAASATGENVFTSESVAPVVEPNVAGDYLPLGVFAFGPSGARDPSALLQLAVSKDGEMRGNYFDVVTGQQQIIEGKLDKQTQLATFKLSSPASAEFEVSLVSLTRPEGSARLRFDNGQYQDWSLARFDPQAMDAKQ